jgi:hypothetical protein
MYFPKSEYPGARVLAQCAWQNERAAAEAPR